MSVKSEYYKLNEKDFKNYLDNLKKSSNSIHLLNNAYFFSPTFEISNLTIKLNSKVNEFDSLINSFFPFSRKQILQSFLIDEIESTSKIENIHSTKHDIFSVIDNVSAIKDKKITSIANTYKLLLESNGTQISSLKTIRDIYDEVLKDAISKDDLPDGTFFRKGPVYITNGIKNIHVGVIGEEKIAELMNEFLKLYNSDFEIFTKMVLCHFMFEYAHPFYDGNGRLGRYLFSNGLYLETGTNFSFLISSSFAKEKSKYLKAFEEANDIHEFGCLNTYVETIISILLNQVETSIQNLKEISKKIRAYQTKKDISKSEAKIAKILYESSLLSNFGISNQEIINETGVSKRTLIYTLNKYRNENRLIETKIGRFTYHKIKDQ